MCLLRRSDIFALQQVQLKHRQSPQMLLSISLVCPASKSLASTVSTGRRVTRHKMTEPTNVANNTKSSNDYSMETGSFRHRTLVLGGSLVPDRGIRSSLPCEGESQERGPNRDQSQWSASPSDAAPMSSCGFCISNPGIPRCDQVHCGRSVQWGNVEERFMLEPCGTSLNSPNGGHKCSNGRQTEANGTTGVLYLSSPTGSIERSPRTVQNTKT